MKKRYILILSAFITCLSLAAQQNNNETIELVKSIYESNVELRLANIKAVLKAENKDVDFEDIYTTIAKIYTEKFTPKEIRQLFSFYQSPLGKKILKTQNQLNQEADLIVAEWEMEKNGIKIQENRMTDEDYFKMVDSIQVADKAVFEKRLKAAQLPEIRSLADLRALLMEDPTAMSDSRLLQKILGEEVDVDELFIKFYQKKEKEEHQGK